MIVDQDKGTVNWIDSGLVGMGDHPQVPGAKAHRLAPELQVGALLDGGQGLDWIGSEMFLDNMLDRRSAALRKDGFHYTPFSS